MKKEIAKILEELDDCKLLMKSTGELMIDSGEKDFPSHGKEMIGASDMIQSWIEEIGE